MRFVIRDDDTSFFTQPEQLEEVYGGLWDRFPISLAVVPFHGCTVSGALPQALWEGEGTFPLHHNARLVAYLRALIQRRRVSILLHGFDHVDCHGRAEFDSDLTAPALAERIESGRDYLEGLLETTVGTFVPPHNTLSRAALEALSMLRMNVMGTFSFRPWRRPMPLLCLAPMARRRLFCWRQRWRGGRAAFYPWPLEVAGHKEMACHDLNRDPRCRLDDLIDRLDRTHEAGGDFCLATHYWEVKEPPLVGWFARLLELATAKGAVFVHADDLFGAAVAAARREAAA